MTVSSTNLTPDAFAGQVQSGWTVTLPIEQSAVLPHSKSLYAEIGLFLGELGNEAECEDRTSYFYEILKRCRQVEGSHFVASIPRSKAPSPFVALKSARGQRASSKLRILTPSIGHWHSKELSELRGWCSALGILPSDIQVIWPAKGHDWISRPTGSDAGAWKMPHQTLPALIACKISILEMPSTPNDEAFGNGTSGRDERWWHTKFYEFDEGLLLGSHNWSKSAWGTPRKQPPKNFELSVFVAKCRIPLPKLLAVLSTDEVPTMETKNDLNGFWLRWACATWDGERLVFKFRVSAGTKTNAHWLYDQTWRKFASIIPEGKQVKATVKCKAAQPGFVLLSKSGSGSSIKIAVLDIREGDALPYGLSESIQQSADLLLLESYGGPIAVDLPRGRPRKKLNSEVGNWDAAAADYRPDWLVAARYWTSIVDKWREKWKEHPCAARLRDAKRLANAIQIKLSEAELLGSAELLTDNDLNVGAKIAIEEFLSLSESKIDR